MSMRLLFKLEVQKSFEKVIFNSFLFLLLLSGFFFNHKFLAFEQGCVDILYPRHFCKIAQNSSVWAAIICDISQHNLVSIKGLTRHVCFAFAALWYFCIFLKIQRNLCSLTVLIFFWQLANTFCALPQLKSIKIKVTFVSRYLMNPDQTLQIHYVTAQDAGKYTCTAVNDVGVVTATAQLLVEGQSMSVWFLLCTSFGETFIPINALF